MSEQTPDEWLLERYDREAADPFRTRHNHVRPLFSVLDDHPASNCTERVTSFGECRDWNGAATWKAGQWPTTNDTT